MDPQWVLAVCAIAGVVFSWSTSIATIVLWLTGRLSKMKDDIHEMKTDILEDAQRKHEERVSDVQKKHEENNRKINALETLVIRHDTMLNAEWNGGMQQRR